MRGWGGPNPNPNANPSPNPNPYPNPTCGSSITAPPLISSPQVAHAPSCHCVRAAAATAAAAAGAAAGCTGGGGPAVTRSATRVASSVKPAANWRTAQVPKTLCSPVTVCRLDCNRTVRMLGCGPVGPRLLPYVC